jgi:Na+/H+ antiporter NhaD/arsenite permease-like protein
MRTSLDGHGIFAIIVFAIVALICIQPLRIPLPHFVGNAYQKAKQRLFGSSAIDSKERTYLVLNHVWTPAIGIVFLLATKTIGGTQIKLGIVGEDGVEPYDVLALFIGLAYIAISLDATGLLRYLAFQVCQRAGSNGYVLYLILFAFFWILGVLVGNDPVILSGTAFLVHLTRVAGISPPSAWIWAQFVAANISSAVLVSSNPTNLVIATGFNVSFPVYTAYMILPSFVSAMVSLGILLLFFRNRTQSQHNNRKNRRSGLDLVRGWTKARKTSQTVLQPRTSQPRNTDEGIELTNVPSNGTAPGQGEAHQDEQEKKGPLIFIPSAIIRPDVNARAALVDPKGAIFNSCIMAATLLTLIITSVFSHVKVYMIAAPGAGVCLLRDIAYDWYTWRNSRSQAMSKKDAEVQPPKESTDQRREQAIAEEQPAAVDQAVLGRMVAAFHHLGEMFPTVGYVLARLPFPLLPFAFGMFILVQSLSYVGFINILASGIGRVCSHGPAACAIFISVLGVILCNVSWKRNQVPFRYLLPSLLSAWRYQHRCHHSPHKGTSIFCLSIPPGTFSSRAHHKGSLLFCRLWVQCGCTWRHICSKSCGIVVARCTTTARCSSHKVAISSVV